MSVCHWSRYDLGRDEVVSLATNSDGTRSPISKALYTATVKAVQGPAYFGNLTRDDINHGIMIDGRIAVLTVSILEPGNGSKPCVSERHFLPVTRASLVPKAEGCAFGACSQKHDMDRHNQFDRICRVHRHRRLCRPLDWTLLLHSPSSPQAPWGHVYVVMARERRVAGRASIEGQTRRVPAFGPVRVAVFDALPCRYD